MITEAPSGDRGLRSAGLLVEPVDGAGEAFGGSESGAGEAFGGSGYDMKEEDKGQEKGDMRGLSVLVLERSHAPGEGSSGVAAAWAVGSALPRVHEETRSAFCGDLAQKGTTIFIPADRGGDDVDP